MSQDYQNVKENEQTEQSQQSKGRRPEFIGYDVRQGPAEKDIWIKTAAAWNHKDGKGFTVYPEVGDPIVFREMRDRRMEEYQQQQKEIQSQEQENGAMKVPQQVHER